MSNTFFRKTWPWVIEVLVTIRAQMVTSMIIFLITLGASSVIIFTSGYSAAAQKKVLDTVDQAGTRSIEIRSIKGSPGFDMDLLNVISGYDIVESVIGFSGAFDVSAAENPDGTRVAARKVYGDLAGRLYDEIGVVGLKTQPALAAGESLRRLGLPEGGAVRMAIDGPDFQVIKNIEIPDYLDKLMPLILIPQNDRNAQIETLIITADKPENLSLLTDLVHDLLSGIDPETYSFSTSQEFASLRSALDGAMTANSHKLIVASLAAGALSVMLVAWATVLLRRKDYGRRRALGATRGAIIAISLAQIGAVTLAGTFFGVCTSLAVFALRWSQLPPLEFCGSVVAALTALSICFSFLPALWAAGRDPLVELRVP